MAGQVSCQWDWEETMVLGMVDSPLGPASLGAFIMVSHASSMTHLSSLLLHSSDTWIMCLWLLIASEGLFWHVPLWVLCWTFGVCCWKSLRLAHLVRTCCLEVWMQQVLLGTAIWNAAGVFWSVFVLYDLFGCWCDWRLCHLARLEGSNYFWNGLFVCFLLINFFILFNQLIGFLFTFCFT